MSYFMQNGDHFSPTPSKDSVLGELPVGNYIVVETMMGLMFKRVSAFDAPGRMYGNITQRAERILSTFLDRPRTTGVLLSGEKGSGKSQLARNISHAGYDLGIPTIIVNAPFAGDAFNALLASVEQPAIILMDEFEKVYAAEQQEQVLTLLDGMMTSKKLFVLTVNDKYRVNDHMKNRPGRIYYAIEFDGLESEFVREYCADNLDNQDETENVLRIGALFRSFNFDMLKALVEEMNRYKEGAFDAIDLLNAKPMNLDTGSTYEVTATTKGGFVSEVQQTQELPMSVRQGAVGMYLQFMAPKSKPDLRKFANDLNEDLEEVTENQAAGLHIAIRTQDLKKIDVDAGRFEFQVDDHIVVFKRKAATSYDLRDIAAY